jgi:SPP1 gp7 family putative phage head morphogenesis protein
MITRVNVSNLKDWRQAAFKAQGGPQIYNLLKEELDSRGRKQLNDYISETARYISDIPADVAKSLMEEIAGAQQRGIRPDAISSILKLKFPTLVNTKIKMLARTGTSSASSNLTRIRSEDLGIPCFVWDTSEDQRVRPSHRIMDGVVVFWSDLPSPEELNGGKPVLGRYIAGDAPNCRCFCRPVLTLEDLFSAKKTSVRVYLNGHIEYMTRQKFANLSGIESRLAA